MEEKDDKIAVHSESAKKEFDYDEWLAWYEKWCEEHHDEIEKEWIEYWRKH